MIERLKIEMSTLAGYLLEREGTNHSRTVQRLSTSRPQESDMIADIVVSTPPVLAAGWSLLYLLFGGGLGGAVLIFFGLKLIGR